MKRTLNIRRSDREATRASTLSSGEPGDEAMEDFATPSTSTSTTSSSRGKEKKRKTSLNANVSTQPLEDEPHPFTEEQMALINKVVQNAVQYIIPDAAQQAAEVAVALANKSNTNAQTQQAQTLEAECNGFERIGFSATPITQPIDTSDDIFNPAFPANFIKAIQNGEFLTYQSFSPETCTKYQLHQTKGNFPFRLGQILNLNLPKISPTRSR